MSNFKFFTAQRDTSCDRCQTELPAGVSCYAGDGEIICLECNEKLESDDSLKGGEKI